MDYKEKYQEALERAKKGLPIDEVFPELKESEDERIRKELIQLLSKMTDGIVENYTPIPLRDFLAYLERQKKQTIKIDACGFPIRVQGESACSYLARCLAPDMRNIWYEACAEIKEKQKEQKLTECTSDSVLQKIKRAITDCRELSEHYKDTKENFYQYYGGKADGLQLALAYFGNKNELAEQKPAEWSKEDEKHKQAIIDAVQIVMEECVDAESIEKYKDDIDWLENRLKYLKDRGNSQKSNTNSSSWKPSDEQISALEYFIRSWGESGTMSPQNTILCAAKSLLNDLKKL